jgi:hypothetical protein
MSERFAAEISIGGKVPAGTLKKFLEELNSIRGRVGGYDGDPFGAETADELRQALDESGHLHLADAEASFGQFEDLEEFCVKKVIPFDRHSDAHYDFDSETVYFRAGMESPLAVYSNNQSDDLTDVAKVRPIAKELARLAKGGLTTDELLAAVVKVSGDLAAALPPEVDPLPPLEIVE